MRARSRIAKAGISVRWGRMEELLLASRERTWELEEVSRSASQVEGSAAFTGARDGGG